ncbi:PTS sugar transporter subunit IIA [Listeria costaricensis]|uniref:PTS sugar transporter subunit IIA n=1 Tax=Listeria costaricensis TaxID=2026604 RepID=UPI000C08BA01|nr:PTS glucose transporter subunit IIA [Listeria costaricensis]
MFKKLFKHEKNETVYAHATGQLISLEEVPDPVFNQKMMGEGIAVQPVDGRVVAPADGEIIQIAETKHAFGIRTELGEEILVHIGLETVALKGEGFQVKVALGDKVKRGQTIIEADLAYIAQHASSTVIPMVVTNSAEGQFEFDWQTNLEVKAGETPVFITKIR